MNLIKSTIATVLLLSLSYFNGYNQDYCIPNPKYGGGEGDYIDSISLSNIQIISGYEDSNYVDYNDQKIELGKGLKYELTIKSGTYTNDTYAAWIDYNRDGDFLDINEKLGEFIAPTAGYISTIKFTVPDSMDNGKTCLRIRCVWNASDIDPCADYSYGETEDYYVNISSFDALNLTGIPQLYYNICSAFADMNNDGHTDYIVIGFTDDPLAPVADVYINDGNNNFTPASVGIMELMFSFFSITDYNNDGWLDIFLSGTDGSDFFNILYTNKKDGSFNEIIPDMPTILAYSQEWGDYTMDGKPDLLLSGDLIQPGIDEKITALYEYNKSHNAFQEIEIGLPEIRGRAKFIDFDNDNDLDIVVSGIDDYDNKYTKLYTHLKDHSVSLIQPNIKGSFYNNFDWLDYDNDNDFDIAVNGLITDKMKTIIYKNENDTLHDIVRTFEKDIIPSINPAIYWIDLKNDGIPDIFNGGSFNNIVYGGKDLLFSESENLFPEDLFGAESNYLAIPIVDINNDNSPDFYVNGYFDEEGEGFGRNLVLINNPDKSNAPPSVPGNLSYTINGRDVVLSWLNSVDDYTPDNRISYNVYIKDLTKLLDNEVVIPLSDISTGKLKTLQKGNAGYNCKYLIQNVNTKHEYCCRVQAIDDNYASSKYSDSIVFIVPSPFQVDSDLICQPTLQMICDIDTNQTLDIIVLDGYDPGEDGFKEEYKDSTYIFINNYPDSIYQSYLNMNISDGNVFLGDYDNDNNVDYQIQGYYIEYEDGTNNILYYHPYRNTLIDKSLMNGNGDFGDFDNDGDQDLLVIGNDSLNYYYTLILKNNDAAFSAITHNIPALSYGTVKWIDYDNDLDLDLFISGIDSNNTYYTDIFKNNRGNFTPIGMKIMNFSETIVDWGDYDNDGDFDLAISGLDEFNMNNITQIFRNDNGDNFTMILEIPSYAAVDWGDYDNDGWLDLIVDNSVWLNLGNDSFKPFYSLYTDSWGDLNNDGFLDIISDKTAYSQSVSVKNTKPGAPYNLSYDTDSLDIVLYWNDAVDAQSTYGGLYYNIRIGTEKDGVDIMSPCSNIKTGKLFYPNFGNVGCNSSWKLKGLKPGKYYWSVQAIDHSYEGGAWATVDSFDVKELGAEFSFDTVCHGSITTFNDQSVTSDTIIKWKWDFGDGTISLEKDIEHFYSNADTFDVSLTVYSSKGDSASRAHMVTVKPAPDAIFTVNPVCLGNASEFINHSDTTDLKVITWLWDFGNGEISDYRGNTSQLYSESNKAILTINAENGCWDTVTKNVSVYSRPDAVFSLAPGDATVFCEGDSAVLSVMNYNVNNDYLWYFNDVIHEVINPRKFVVKKTGQLYLLVQNSFVEGCNDISTTISIEVHGTQKPVIQKMYGPDELCPDDVVKIRVIDIDTSYYFDWRLNGENLNKLNQKEQTGFLNEGIYNVIANFNDNCPVISNSVAIQHKPSPPKPMIFVNEGPDLFYMSCENTTAESYKWYYNGNIIPNANKYYYFAGNQLGKYQAEITVNFSECIVKSFEIIVPGGYVSIKPTVENVLEIYPNPNNGNFNIIRDASQQQDILKIEIYNATGILEYSETAINKNNELYIESGIKSEGVYYIKVYSKTGVYSYRFMIH